MNAATLPPNITRRIAPETRKSLGITTHEEALAKLAALEEKQLQNQIGGLLRIHGVEANVSRMDRKKTDKKSWGDFTLCIHGRGIIWECKRPGAKLRPEQEQLRQKLIAPPNGWRYDVIYTVAEAVAILRELQVIK